MIPNKDFIWYKDSPALVKKLMKNKKFSSSWRHSGEREISKKSGQACKKALINIGYKNNF